MGFRIHYSGGGGEWQKKMLMLKRHFFQFFFPYIVSREGAQVLYPLLITVHDNRVMAKTTVHVGMFDNLPNLVLDSFLIKQVSTTKSVGVLID